jgi:hypothetical protein
MEGNPLFKKYQHITDQLVLFNEEYYLSVAKWDIASLSGGAREELFNHLYGFDSADIELEIDVSEEETGSWYLQLLVPHVLTLPEAAVKRIEKGMEQLAAHLQKSKAELEQHLLHGDDMYEYVKRYNPDLQRV